MRRASMIVFLAIGLAGCGTSTPGGDKPTTSPTPDGPPKVVADKRDAIVRAARALDYDALGALLDPKMFSYSYGDSGDPIAYWRRQEEVDHTPILSETLPSVLAMRHAVDDDMFVWPRAHALPAAEWTAEDRQELRTIHSDEEIAAWEAGGSGYLGWRVGIGADGTWLYFIAGD